MRKLTAGLVMAALLGLGAVNASAQTVNGAASVTIPTVTDLTIAGTQFDFTAGATSTAAGAVTVDTRANVLHAVEVTGAALTLGGDNLTVEVQASDLSWSALSATAVKSVAGLTRGTHAGRAINFRTTADVSLHAPGEYTGTITYTVVADI
jgi:hypothetical protein